MSFCCVFFMEKKCVFFRRRKMHVEMWVFNCGPEKKNCKDNFLR